MPHITASGTSNYEAPAPIGQKAQPAAVSRSCEVAEAITASTRRFTPAGFFFPGRQLDRAGSVSVRSRQGLTSRTRNAALWLLQCGSEFAVDDVVDRVLKTYQLMRPLNAEKVADARQKITRYIESLASAGQSDAQQLAVYGLAYLKEMHEGRDPRFTGC
jgi:hypothetical protein